MYVMLPRLLSDYNGRSWGKNHCNALQIIGDILIEMRGGPPFNKQVLGNKANRLSRDIVLVKCVGRPLALFTENILGDYVLQKRYVRAWGNLSVDINLCSYDIDRSLAARRNKGFKSYDFITEIKSYLKIITSLLNTESGLYLCGFFARKVSQAKDPIIAGSLARLVEIVNDRGGKHIFIWHTMRLLSRKKADHAGYLSFVEENNGCDPGYPGIDRIFRNPDITRQLSDIETIAGELGIKMEEIWEKAYERTGRNIEAEEINNLLSNMSGIKNVPEVSYKDLLGAYIKRHPETKNLIENYHDEFLRSVIRGMGSGFAYGIITDSFKSLYEEFWIVNKQSMIEKRIEFALPVKEVGNIDRLKQQEIRKNINLSLIEKIWRVLSDRSEQSANNIMPPINELSMKLNKPIQKKQNERVNLEEGMHGMESGKDKIKKEKKRVGKSLKKLEEQKREYEDIAVVMKE